MGLKICLANAGIEPTTFGILACALLVELRGQKPNSFGISIILNLGDLKTRKGTGTSCQIEIHFSCQISKFLINYNLLRFQISGRLTV